VESDSLCKRHPVTLHQEQAERQRDRHPAKAGAGLDAYPQKAGNDNQLWQILPDPSGLSNAATTPSVFEKSNASSKDNLKGA